MSMFGAGALFSALFIFSAYHIVRFIRIRTLRLKVNCLLTHYPIVILVGSSQTLFDYKKWKNLLNFKAVDPYTYLLAHGYSAIKMSTQQFIKLNTQIYEQHKGAHVFDSEIDSQWLKNVNIHPELVKSHTRTSQLSSEGCLQVAISLAENDFQCSH